MKILSTPNILTSTILSLNLLTLPSFAVTQAVPSSPDPVNSIAEQVSQKQPDSCIINGQKITKGMLVKMNDGTQFKVLGFERVDFNRVKVNLGIPKWGVAVTNYLICNG